MRNPIFLKYASIFTFAVLLAGVTGCTDQTRTRAEGAGAGALLGAGLGALIGSASGNAGRGALIGAGVGSLAGLAYGDHVARKKARYASEEQWLDACIAQAIQVNNSVRSYNNSLENRIASLDSQIRSAKAANDRRKLQQLKQQVTTLKTETKQQITIVQTEISEQSKVVRSTSSSKTSTLSTQITRLESTKSSVQSNFNRLASLENSIDI